MTRLENVLRLINAIKYNAVDGAFEAFHEEQCLTIYIDIPLWQLPHFHAAISSTGEKGPIN